MVWERLGSASVSGSLANNSWKELGRTTLSGTNDSIDVSNFTAKDNLMILCNVINSGGDFRTFWRFNSDTGSNYSQRYNTNGGSDATNTSLNGTMDWNTAESVQSFEVLNITNITAQEKLGIKHKIGSNTAGAGNAPNRVEAVGKWANTSAQITSVSVGDGVDPKSGTGGIGSEVVVLGYDNDEADSGTNFWQELGSTELTSAGDDVTVSFTAKKYLMVESYMVGGSGNNFRNAWKLNGTSSGSTYAYRKSSNGGSDNTYTSRNLLEIGDQDQAHDSYQKLFILNPSGREKLGIMEAVREENDSNSEPSRTECVFKWATTSGQITSITAHNDQSGNFGVGSYVKVYGAD